MQAGSQCLPAERSQSEQQTSLNLFAKPLIEYLLDTREPAKFIALGASEAYDQENGKDHDSEGKISFPLLRCLSLNEECM